MDQCSVNRAFQAFARHDEDAELICGLKIGRDVRSHFGRDHDRRESAMRTVRSSKASTRRLGPFVQKRKFIFCLKQSRGAFHDGKMAQRCRHKQVGGIPGSSGIEVRDAKSEHPEKPRDGGFQVARVLATPLGIADCCHERFQLGIESFVNSPPRVLRSLWIAQPKVVLCNPIVTNRAIQCRGRRNLKRNVAAVGLIFLGPLHSRARDDGTSGRAHRHISSIVERHAVARKPFGH
jgi:hypothetical protein